jgi:hypothetical protein
VTEIRTQAAASEEEALIRIDTTRPHIARVYDYWLGGKDHFAADRELGDEMMEAYPDLVSSVRANREFLGRAVRYLASEGIRQFLDIGTGIPAANNTHEIAQAIAPESRIVYVDNDPIVLAHARALLVSSAQGACGYIDADLRDTGTILEQAAVVMDFTKPVAVVLAAVLHMIPDADDPAGIVTRLAGAVPAGSFVAISHPASDIAVEQSAEVLRRFNDRAAAKGSMRSHQQVTGFFGGLELLPPGVVRAPEWRPETELEASRESNLWCGIGRKG